MKKTNILLFLTPLFSSCLFADNTIQKTHDNAPAFSDFKGNVTINYTSKIERKDAIGNNRKCFYGDYNIGKEKLKTMILCYENIIKKLEQSKNKSIVVNTFPNIPHPATTKSTNFKKFRINLLSCKRNLTDVNCILTIKNLGKDDYFKFDQYDDEFIDEKGNGMGKYKLSFIDMGNGEKYRKLYTNIPINVKIIINNVPENVTQFIRFKLDLDGGFIKFNNVAIQ